MAVSAGAVRGREELPPVALGATGTSVTLCGHPEDPSSPAVRAAPGSRPLRGETGGVQSTRRLPLRRRHWLPTRSHVLLEATTRPFRLLTRRHAPVSRGRGRSPAARAHAVAPSQLPARLSRTEAPAG